MFPNNNNNNNHNYVIRPDRINTPRIRNLYSNIDTRRFRLNDIIIPFTTQTICTTRIKRQLNAAVKTLRITASLSEKTKKYYEKAKSN